MEANQKFNKLSVGVVIATYNGEKYIYQQIKSILKQTRIPNEIIVSDGGSMDNTVEICRKIFSEYQSVHSVVLTSDVQLGVSTNFERGLRNCTADYVFFADQDDIWKPNKIEIFINLMIEYDAAFAFSDAEIVDGELKLTGRGLWESVDYYQKENVRIINSCEEEFLRNLLRRNTVTGMCMCLRKDFINHVLPFNENTLHDKWIALFAALSFKSIAINDKLVLYRQHGGNVVGTKTNLKRMLKNRKKYLNNVLWRIKMLENVMDRTKPQNEKIYNIMKDSIVFHNNRVEFMDKKKNIFWPLMNIKQYKLNESSEMCSIVKDYLTRLIKSD